MKRLFITFLLFLLVTSACSTRFNSLQVQNAKAEQSHFVNSEQREIVVHHEIKGQDVYVECIVNDFSFESRKKETRKEGQGHLHLFLNGTKIDEIYQAAFIIKGLPKGTHQLQIELVHNDHTTYDLKHDFEVTIN
jgi:hypothetical protein